MSGVFDAVSLRTKIAWSQHMAARSMWNGKLALGKTSIGVKLFAAIEDQTLHFHLLHAEDHERVEQRMLNPKTGEVRAGTEVHKGYEIKPGTFVLLDPKELAKLEPPPSKVIQVQQFVPAAEIEPVWYERPYFVGPEGKSPEYFALARLLAERGLVAVVRWVMRKHAYHGALRAHGDYLTLSTLHSPEEVVAAPAVTPATRTADARELAMAQQLVNALAGEFAPSEFQDEHRARVLELIAAKAKGKSLKPPPRQRERAPRLLGDALEQSLKMLQKPSKAKGARPDGGLTPEPGRERTCQGLQGIASEPQPARNGEAQQQGRSAAAPSGGGSSLSCSDVRNQQQTCRKARARMGPSSTLPTAQQPAATADIRIAPNLECDDVRWPLVALAVTSTSPARAATFATLSETSHAGRAKTDGCAASCLEGGRGALA